MDLQIEATWMAACDNVIEQAQYARNRFRISVLSMLQSLVLMVVCVMPAAYAGAQVVQLNRSGVRPLDLSSTAEEAEAVLPEAPSALLQEAITQETTQEKTSRAATADASVSRSAQPRIAPIHTKYIPAGWVAQPLTPRDKAILGVHSLYSPFSVIGYFVSAGYSHVVNSQPNYGTDSAAFGQRVGAAVLRDTTEGAFTDAVFAPLLHEDPRYYVEGRRHGYVHRVLYAMTRPLITRSDSGHEIPNAALLLGQASACAFSYTYYPKINQNFHDTAATFGGSLAGSAIDDVISEFSGQFLKELHLRKSAAMPR